MIFDATLSVIDIRVLDVSEGDEHVVLGMIVGFQLPLAPGPGQPPIVAPVGMLRVPMDRETAESVRDGFNDNVEKLPKRSALIQADSLAGLDDVAEFERRLREGK